MNDILAVEYLYENHTVFKNKIPLRKYNDKYLGKVKKEKNMYLGQPMSTNNL